MSEMHCRRTSANAIIRDIFVTADSDENPRIGGRRPRRAYRAGLILAANADASVRLVVDVVRDSPVGDSDVRARGEPARSTSVWRTTGARIDREYEVIGRILGIVRKLDPNEPCVDSGRIVNPATGPNPQNPGSPSTVARTLKARVCQPEE